MGYDGYISGIACDSFLQSFDFGGIGFEDFVLQLIPLAQMTGFQGFQLAHLCGEIAMVNDFGVACGKRLNFGVVQRNLVNLLHDARQGFGGENLPNIPLFVLYHLVKISVERHLLSRCFFDFIYSEM